MIDGMIFFKYFLMAKLDDRCQITGISKTEQHKVKHSRIIQSADITINCTSFNMSSLLLLKQGDSAVTKNGLQNLFYSS